MLHYSALDARSGRVTIRELGHVALFVRDLDATRRFYRDILGLAEPGTGKGGRIVFFSTGVHHHDLSCELARAEGPGPQPKGVPGLYHIAFDVGVALETFRRRAGGRRRTASSRSARRRPRSPCAIPTATRSSCTSSRPPDQRTRADPGSRGAGRTRHIETTPAASVSQTKPNAGK